MKTKMLLLVCWGIAGLVNILPAQTPAPVNAPVKCRDYACMMQKAYTYLEAKNFKAAFNSATAAKRYSNANKIEADSLIEVIFQKINQLRLDAEEAREAAYNAKIAAEISEKKAKSATIDAENAKNEANRQRDSVVLARTKVEELVQKGKTLENTFSDSSAYNYLYHTGLKYFQWDTIVQSRDYRNALTYFALARFLKPSDTLDCLVFAAKMGIKAEADFINGQLTDAESKFLLIKSKVDCTPSQRSDFEQTRIAQIKEVRDLFQAYKQQHDTLITSATLEGKWWTIPIDFRQYQSISTLVFRNLPVNFRQFPTVLGSLPDLTSLAIVGCPKVSNLYNWGGLRHLQTLRLQDDANLYALDSLQNIKQLTSLYIDSCPALTQIVGCKNLEHFAIKSSPQARVSALLQNNPNLKNLELADLPEKSFNSERLTELESLSLSNMNNVRNLDGLDKNTRLRKVKINHLDALRTFAPPGYLTTAYISHCDSLNGLYTWPQSDSLSKLVIFENDKLDSLPDWKRFPNMNDLLIKGNNNITAVKGLKSLKNTKRLFLLNNPRLSTNSVNAGFGFEWNINFPSLKLEFEHRQSIKWLENQDFGFKIQGLYVRKKFKDDALYTARETKGFAVGLVLTYYSPYTIYVGVGGGLGRTENSFPTQTPQRKTNFVWINSLGFQLAPWFLKKDKLSIGVDLYNIFGKKDYFIFPSFGLTYYHILDFNGKTHFLRISDSSKLNVLKRHWDQIDVSPEKF